MNKDMERIVDLLVERSIRGLDDDARLQLDVLLAGVDEQQRLRLETQVEATLAAAGNASALMGAGPAEAPPPPEHLLAKLEADADRYFGATVTGVGTGDGTVTALHPRRSRRGAADTGDVAEVTTRHRDLPRATGRQQAAAWSGWAVAALLLITLWVGRPGPTAGPDPVPATLAESRTALIADAGTLQLDWAPSAWADFEGVRGDVSWNDERQEGYLRLVGMPANDPLLSQYQLWIVDPGRDEEPVDGGVFDIPPGATEVIVPIAAKLAVDRPAAFAITRERPGGVVVSEGPLLVVASRG